MGRSDPQPPPGLPVAGPPTLKEVQKQIDDEHDARKGAAIKADFHQIYSYTKESAKQRITWKKSLVSQLSGPNKNVTSTPILSTMTQQLWEIHVLVVFAAVVGAVA